MKNHALLEHVQNFFKEYLISQKGLSHNTVIAYRDALKLFLDYVARSKNKEVTKLTPDDLSPDVVLEFLKSIESQRKNSIITRNLRLAALKSFFSYMAMKDTLRSGEYQRITMIPPKRTSKPMMGYLKMGEVKAILGAIDQRAPGGERDYVLLSFLYNIGARVQELCDLRVKDLHLETPPFVNILGKGKKTRQVPLWPETVGLLNSYLEKHHSPGAESAVFMNARSEPLGRFGIRYIIRKRVQAATEHCPGLKSKTIGPHTFRHTTAMHLLQAGVDLTVIKNWLGHARLSTTHGYIEIDLEMKRKALARCRPADDQNKLKRLIRKNQDIIEWLESL